MKVKFLLHFLLPFMVGIICLSFNVYGSMLELAFEAHQKGDLPLAKKYYIKSLKSLPKKETGNRAIINFNLGNLYYSEGKLSDAVLHYQRTIELAPNFKESYLNLGRINYLYDNYSRALEIFLAYQNQNPDDYENNLLLADTYKKLRMYPDSLEQYRQAIRLKPYSEEGYIALADFYLGFDDMDMAHKEVVAGYENVDFSKQLLLYEADLLRKTGRYNEAVTVYRSVFQGEQVTNFSLDERYNVELKIVDSLLSVSNVNYALFELEKVVKNNPQKDVGINYLENIYIVYKKTSRGFSFFKTFYPQNSEASYQAMKNLLADAYNQDNLFLVKNIIKFFDKNNLRDELSDAIKNELQL